MEINENTRLSDLMDAYPWMPDAAAKKDPRLQIVHTPLARVLIKKYTVADVSRRTGYPVRDILQEIRRLIAEHEDV